MQNFALIRDFILENHKKSNSTYLATLIKRSGTTFGRVGQKMAFSELGDFQGLISGGCLEADIVEHGLGMPIDRIKKIVHYDLSSSEDLIFGTGSGCPGTIDVLIERLDIKTHEKLFEILLDKTQAMPSFIKSSNLEDLEQASSYHPLKSEIPGNIEYETLGDHVQKIVANSPKVEQKDSVFNDVNLKQPGMTIVGAGLISRSLLELAKRTGWFTNLVSYKKNLSFQALESIADSAHVLEPNQIPSKVSQSLLEYVLLISHRFEEDQASLNSLSTCPIYFLGLLGSHSRLQHIREGLPGDYPHHIHCPLGLPLGGRSPEEISLSIMAEVLQNYYRKN
ncbi:MAG: XdhC family protein [Oligoflexales bacterium]|nr:XdhC family protein [Oligoflexales bacterium]